MRPRWIETVVDEFWGADGGRIVDIGGPAEGDEEYGEGKNLVIFSLDPGDTTGWSVLKVPVARLRATGATRTLPWCRWRHGQILRSGALGTGAMAQAVSDSRHVSLIMEQALNIYEEFMFLTDEDGIAKGWESDEFVFVLESFSLRMLSMDTNLLAPVRVLDRILDRLWIAQSHIPVFFQSPSDAKASVTDDRLRRWAMYDARSGPHARDADRHAVLFLRRFADSREIQEGLGFS